MKTRGHLTVRNLTVKISATPMGLCTALRLQKARSTSEESTSGLSEKLKVNRVVNDPNQTGRHTMVPVTYSKPKLKNLTEISSNEK
jgi:hypothetical protein